MITDGLVNLKAIILCIVLCLSCAKYTHAQPLISSTLNASGSSVIKGYYGFDWSVGESAAISTLVTEKTMVTQGILQYHAGNVIDKNMAIIWFPNELRLFPNPVKNILEIDIKHRMPGDIHLELFSNSGQFLWHKKVSYNGVSHVEKLNMAGMPAGQYTLFIVQDRVAENYGLKKYYKSGAFNIIKIE